MSERRSVSLSARGARIIQLLAPHPWERGGDSVEVRGSRVSWDSPYDSVLLSQTGPGTGFPRGDRERILRAIERGRERHKFGRLSLFELGKAEERRRVARRAGQYRHSEQPHRHVHRSR